MASPPGVVANRHILEAPTTPAGIDAALSNDGRALARLLRGLRPTVRESVRATARPWARRAGRDLDVELEDLVQDVFVHLLRDGARALRAWEPERGRSLTSFVALLARRHVVSALRSRARNPWFEEPQPSDVLERGRGPTDAEARYQARARLRALHGRVEAELSPLGRRLFRRLMVDDEDVVGICAAEAMTRDAVYAWRSRLRRFARAEGASG